MKHLYTNHQFFGFQPLVFPRIQQFLGSKPPIFGVEGFTDLTLQVTLLQSTTGGVDWRDAFDALAPTGVVLQVGTMIGDPPKRERMERMVETFFGEDCWICWFVFRNFREENIMNTFFS